MKKYVYILFFMYSSMSAVPGLQKSSTTVVFGEKSRTAVFEEHPPSKVTRCSQNVDDCLKECDKCMPDCLDDLLQPANANERCAINCAMGICMLDGAAKLCAWITCLLP